MQLLMRLFKPFQLRPTKPSSRGPVFVEVDKRRLEKAVKKVVRKNKDALIELRDR